MRRILRGQQRSDRPPPIGKAALIESAGGQRGYADWTNPDHRLRRLLSEFIGMAGLTFLRPRRRFGRPVRRRRRVV